MFVIMERAREVTLRACWAYLTWRSCLEADTGMGRAPTQLDIGAGGAVESGGD